jgi:copper transport protein
MVATVRPLWHSPLSALLTSTRYGQAWLGRLLLLALGAALLTHLKATRLPPERRLRWLWGMSAAVAGLVALALASQSHAAAVSAAEAPGLPVIPIVADWTHLVAMGLWVGGLGGLVYALGPALAAAGPRNRIPFLAALVPAFSQVAAAAVAALVLTGGYQVVLQVGSLAALRGTAYGQALVLKLALAVPLVLAGAVNLLLIGPRLRRAAQRGQGTQAVRVVEGGPTGRSAFLGSRRLPRLFLLTIGIEAVLAGALLVPTSVMGLSPPAKTEWTERQLAGTASEDSSSHSSSHSS